MCVGVWVGRCGWMCVGVDMGCGWVCVGGWVDVGVWGVGRCVCGWWWDGG